YRAAVDEAEVGTHGFAICDRAKIADVGLYGADGVRARVKRNRRRTDADLDPVEEVPGLCDNRGDIGVVLVVRCDGDGLPIHADDLARLFVDKEVKLSDLTRVGPHLEDGRAVGRRLQQSVLMPAQDQIYAGGAL